MRQALGAPAAVVVSLVLVALLGITGATSAHNAIRGQPTARLEPDENPTLLSNSIADAAFSPTFSYLHVAGSTLQPRASATGWASAGGGGCIYRTTAANTWFNIDVDLPAGSRVDYLRMYYYDTSANDSIAWLTRYDGAGGVSDRLSVSSSGNSGYGTVLSAYQGDVLDDPNYSYVLNWQSDQVGNTVMLCGLRIAYRLPAQSVYLPVVRKS